MTSDRGHLETERGHPATTELDRLPSAEAVALLLRIDREAFAAVEAAGAEIARAVDLVAGRLARGGRLVYAGAGTSGRLAALDAAECPPTFHSAPEQVQALLAGGTAALQGPVEGAEDSREEAARGVARLDLGPADVLFGISAGGTAPFVHAALEAARERGSATVFLACVPRSAVPDEADVSIRLATGPEAIAGSTRLKAGTATKLVLNAVSTLAMVRLGRVHGNRMVAVDARANAKLVDRAERLVVELAEVGRERARTLLEAAGGRVETAVVMQRLGLDADGARARLDAAGSLRRALETS